MQSLSACLHGVVHTKTNEITELKVTADTVLNALTEVKVQMELRL